MKTLKVNNSKPQDFSKKKKKKKKTHLKMGQVNFCEEVNCYNFFVCLDDLKFHKFSFVLRCFKGISHYDYQIASFY